MGAAKSQNVLARVLGISQPAVSKLVRSGGWPVRRTPPWSPAEVAKIKAWHQALHSSPVSDPDAAGDLNAALKRVMILLRREQMLNEKHKRQIAEAEYVRRELLDGAMGGLAAIFVSMLDELEISAPSRLAGKDVAAMSLELGRLMDVYRRRLLENAEVKLQKLTDVQASRGRGRPMAGGSA